MTPSIASSDGEGGVFLLMLRARCVVSVRERCRISECEKVLVKPVSENDTCHPNTYLSLQMVPIM